VTTIAVEGVTLPAQPVAVVRGHATLGDLPGFLDAAFEETLAALTAQGDEPAGPPFARYRIAGDGFDVEAGFPASAAVTATGRVVPAELPGGPAAQVRYRGPYPGVARAYEAGQRWLGEHGHAPADVPWESYLDEPDVAEPRTVVCLPYRAG
jgi:effector-binding domain-containing protein